jgi:hypothetical protein
MEKEIIIDSQKTFWADQIDAYERKAKSWCEKGKKVISRYTLEKDRSKTNAPAQFNILWSNVQTLMPAIYDRAPTPNIERRFNKNDKIGKEASTILERSVQYFIDTDEFSDKIQQCVLDRLLPGRGTIWVRYDPTIEQVFNAGEPSSDDQITDDVIEELKYEDVSFDYVHWQDFGHTLGRTWQEVRAVWRRVCMERSELIKRFGDEIGSKIPLNSRAEDTDKDAENDRAEIFEIWDKKTKTVFWVCKNYPELLDQKPDPLGLKDFFPCPKPLYATLANNGLIPTPDFVIYYDQARELDTLTARIDNLLKAVKVSGVYDSSAEGVQRILSEGNENILIPVTNWALFGEKGGLRGVINFMPLDQIVAALQTLYDSRERIKQDLYEITGMSDIIRGASNAAETATAQQIKGQYASMRLGHMQKDVARFCRDLVRITAEIISSQFSPETIKKISSSDLMTEAEKAQIMQAQQFAQQQAQSMGQPVPPVPQIDQKAFEKPSLDQVMELLRNDMARCFRIAIETDSTIKIDQDKEKAARSEFLSAAGGFIQQASQIASPELQPLLMDMLMFGVRGFKAGRELESSFERAAQELEEKNKQPKQENQPNPEAEKMAFEMKMAQQKAQLDIQSAQIKNQIDQAVAQADMQIKNMEVQMKAIDLQIKQMELAIKQTPNIDRVIL